MVSDHEDITQLPGLESDLAQKIAVIINTGKLPQLQELEKRIPKALIAMLRLKGLVLNESKYCFNNYKIKI